VSTALQTTGNTRRAGAGTAPVLELRKVSKRFGSIVANDEVDFQVRAGEIRGLVGENGAGKSTLMAIASGLYRADAGQILVNDVERELRGREDAIALGINMVHQHFMLVPSCTVAQNVVLGQTGPGRFLRLREIEDQVRELAAQYGMEVGPHTRVDSLTPTERQRAEILVALWRGRTVLILDEPTSVLGPNDTRELFSTMRRVAEEGCAVIFTSHKLGEVIEVCDTISVMRAGQLQRTVPRDELDVDTLATLMVGKTMSKTAGSSLLGLHENGADERGGSRRAKRGTTVLRLVDDGEGHGQPRLGELAVHAGEIVGIAGVEGNGQRMLAEKLAGLFRTDGCRVELQGADVSELGPRERAARGMAYVPEDPNSSALIPGFPVAWNLALRDYRSPSMRSWRWFVSFDSLRARAAEAIARFDIRGATEQTRTAALSGGNQQKVVLARELDKNPDALVIVDPTVGLDVGAAENVHRALREHRDRGAAIVLISTDLDEIEALSDRIAVLYRGSIVGVIGHDELDRRRLGLMMTGLAGAHDRRAKDAPRDVA
jgi:ABC-type uncharacterized transport system ATPase subunit